MKLKNNQKLDYTFKWHISMTKSKDHDDKRDDVAIYMSIWRLHANLKIKTSIWS